jgi:hypothetical protein
MFQMRIVSSLETASKPPWEWTRKERLLISELCERLSGREVDPALTAKIETQKRHDYLNSTLLQLKAGLGNLPEAGALTPSKPSKLV